MQLVKLLENCTGKKDASVDNMPNFAV